MNILIGNDDGYDAKGIKTLYKVLSSHHSTTIFAPKSNRSASSSSLTIDKPLQPKKISETIYFVDGTPSDCIHMALCGYLSKQFDIVVSGINLGPNLGDDVIYSGTVAAAIEGRFLGYPSMAISLASWEGKNFETAAKVTEKLLNNIHFSKLSSNTILNINVPDVTFEQIKGYKTTVLGRRHKSEDVFPDGLDSSKYWIGENGKEAENGPGTDFDAIKNNFVSITPLHIDLTNYGEVKVLENWLENLF